MSKCTNEKCDHGLVRVTYLGGFYYDKTCSTCGGTGEMPEKLAESNPEGHQQALIDAHADGVINFEATQSSEKPKQVLVVGGPSSPSQAMLKAISKMPPLIIESTISRKEGDPYSDLPPATSAGSTPAPSDKAQKHWIGQDCPVCGYWIYYNKCANCGREVEPNDTGTNEIKAKTPPPLEVEKSLGQIAYESLYRRQWPRMCKEWIDKPTYVWNNLFSQEREHWEELAQAVASAAVERERQLAHVTFQKIITLTRELAQANERAEKAEAIIVANRVVIQDREDEIAKLQGESGLAEKRAIKSEKDAKGLAKALEWTLNEIGIPSHKSDDLEGYEGRKAAEEALASHNDSTGGEV